MLLVCFPDIAHNLAKIKLYFLQQTLFISVIRTILHTIQKVQRLVWTSLVDFATLMDKQNKIKYITSFYFIVRLA